jgi:hypothetical protein
MRRLLSSLVFAAGILGCTAAFANSCSNVDTMGSYDTSGISDNGNYISAVGSFRIADETDEAKQPMFNLANVFCERHFDEDGKSGSFECKVMKASVWATSAKPDPDKANCSLDVDTTEFSMKELQKGVLLGGEPLASTSCFNTTLTIDKNTKRVYQSFTRTKSADNYDKIKPGTCGALPRTQVLMNCTAWAKMRKGAAAGPGRYCDFSSSSDK